MVQLYGLFAGNADGIQGPVKDIVTDPEYLDITLPAGKSFTHHVKATHTVFAYVIDGEAYFDQARIPFAHDAAGVNYFDMKPPCACGNGTLILYEKGGTNITVTTDHTSSQIFTCVWKTS